MKQLIFTTLLVISMGYGAQASSDVGIFADEITIHCTGVLEVTGVDGTHISNGFFDRAGNWHPPKGFATFNVEVQSLEKGCEPVKNFLEVDVKAKSYKSSEIFNITDPIKLLAKAEEKVGETHNFKVLQKFGFQEKDGFLPFFPLLHQETISLKSATLSLQGAYYKVDVKKVYGNNLYEDDKLQLSEMIFSVLDDPSKTDIYLPTLILALFDHHPSFEENFKAFLNKAMPYYQSYEEQYDADTTDFQLGGILAAFGNSIGTLSYQIPESNHIDLAPIFFNHPSMIVNGTYFQSEKSCANFSAIDIEETLELLKDGLEQGSLHPNVKKNWEDPLKTMGGGLWSASMSSCLGKVTSSHSKSVAKELLKKHY